MDSIEEQTEFAHAQLQWKLEMDLAMRDKDLAHVQELREIQSRILGSLGHGTRGLARFDPLVQLTIRSLFMFFGQSGFPGFDPQPCDTPFISVCFLFVLCIIFEFKVAPTRSKKYLLC